MRQLDLADSPAHLERKTPLRDRFGALLDRWMTSAELYRWSRANALTRWITRRRTRQVFDLMAGFVYSQVLLACVRLRLLETVAEEPRTLPELAQACSVPAAGLQRLLNAAVALRLMELRGEGRYGLGALGAPIAGHAGIRAMIEHHAVLYQDMQDPVALLRDQLDQGRMSHYWPYALDKERDTRRQDWQAEKIARYSDLPQVAALARGNFARQGFGARATAHGGSFLHDRLPTGADLVTLVRVAHDHPDADVAQLLRNIHDALPPGGTLLLAEPMAQHADAPPQGDAYFHFYLLAMGSGRLRTAAELGGLLKAAGFISIERVPNPMPLHTEVLIARKPQGLPANDRNIVKFT